MLVRKGYSNRGTRGRIDRPLAATEVRRKGFGKAGPWSFRKRISDGENKGEKRREGRLIQKIVAVAIDRYSN